MQLKIKWVQFGSLLVLVLSVIGCQQPSLQQLDGIAQGTTYHISFWSRHSIDSVKLREQVEQEFARLDKLISSYRSDSQLEQFNRALTLEPQTVGQEMVDLWEYTRQVSQASAGCYDVTVKPAWELWGFKGDRLTLPAPADLEAALARVGSAKITRVNATQLRKLQKDVQIDFSSIGQGYSVARIASLLEQNQIENYLVEIGGEIQVRGSKPNRLPWHIAIEKPLKTKAIKADRDLQALVVVQRDDPFAVITSGTYRHYFDDNGKQYSHIVDARTGKPIEHNTVSVTVLDADAKVAGTWATALLCLGQQAGKKVADQQGIAAIFIEQQGDQLVQINSAQVERLKGVAFEQ